jgi:hypothetical protein
MFKAIWFGVAVMLFAAAPASAQKRLFAEESAVTFTLNAPFGQLVRTAENSTTPFPGTIALSAEGGAPQSFPLQISARGFTRRTGDFCLFPPIKLDLDKPAMRGTVFEGQNKLKLVTQCRPPASYEQLLVMEYMTYHLYNVVTPMSFRVRPAQVTYHDADGRRPDVTQFAFLIEDTDDVAKRNDRVELELTPNQISSAQLDPQAAAVYGLFELMVGNLDWEYVTGPPGDTCCHNTKIIAREGATSGHIPVPYDFDFSGLVDAPYATPPDNVRVENVRSRYYRGLCRHNEQLPAAAAILQGHRAAFAAVIAAEPRLSAANRQRSQRYLEEFFEILDNPGRFDREVVRRCR